MGVEGDFSAGGIESGRTALFDPEPRTRDIGHSDVKWQAAFRARLGYDMGRILPFATAGLAMAGYQHSVEDPYLFDSFTRIAVGWTIGAGLDFALTQHLIARAEYRYADFGTDHYAWNPGLALAHTVDLSLHDVRLGLAYKF